MCHLPNWHTDRLQAVLFNVLYKYGRAANPPTTKTTMIIATVTRTKYKPGTNKIDYKLVKGQEVKPSVLRKLKQTDRVAWTTNIDKDASINRRIPGRQVALEQLGYFSDVNLEVLKYLSDTYTNRELLDRRINQNSMVKTLEKAVFKHFGYEDRRVELQHTDDFKQGVEASVWIAWPLNEDEAQEVRAYLNSL